jgi:hypothetical protein
MSSPEKADPQPTFSRRSEKESTCMFCFLTIRADKYTPLEDVEEIHADVCLAQPGSAMQLE